MEEINTSGTRICEMMPPSPAPDNTPKMGWLEKCCTLLSWVMVPLLMPVYGMIFVFGLSVLSYSPFPVKLTYVAIIFGINAVLPMAVIYLLKMFGVVKDVGLNNRTDRFIPYMVTAICLLVSAWFISSRHAPMWVTMFFVGGAVAGVINLIVNFWWKISAHAAGAAGVAAMLIRMIRVGFPQHEVLWWLIGWIILTGALGSSRIYQRRHTCLQVLAGYAVGFSSVYLMSLIE